MSGLDAFAEKVGTAPARPRAESANQSVSVPMSGDWASIAAAEEEGEVFERLNAMRTERLTSDGQGGKRFGKVGFGA